MKLEVEGPGTIYFVRSGSLVKIGHSHDLDTRLKTLGISNARLEVIAAIPGTRMAETWLHGQFSEFRVKGEWFQYSDPIKEFLADPTIPAFAPRALRPKRVPTKTIMVLRARLREIRASVKRKMDREIQTRCAPLVAELAELTAFARTAKRRKITLNEVPVLREWQYRETAEKRKTEGL